MTIRLIFRLDRRLTQRIAAGEGVEVVLNVPVPREPGIAADELPDEVKPLLALLLERGLSERLALVAIMDFQGCSRREIAEAFQMSERTVDWYWERIYQGLNVEKRAEVRDILGQLQEEAPGEPLDTQTLAVGELLDDGE